MGLRINADIPAINARRQAQQTSNRLIQGLERLSSGLRINRAADDAAGLAIAERFRARIRQHTQEVNNLQTGVNVIQTAEGGLEAQQEGLGRLQELAVQAANGTLTDEQRAAINEEAQQIIEEIDVVAENTEFNETPLLNGATTTIELGTEGGNQINLNESTANALGVNTVDLTTQAGAAAAVETVGAAINQVSQNRAGLGAQENRLVRAIEQRETGIVNEEAAQSRIRDLDIARQTIEQARNEVLLQGGIAGMIQGNLQTQAAARLLGG